MFLKCLFFFVFLICIDAQFYQRRSNTCALTPLANGKYRLRQKSKLIVYTCHPRYTLVGNKYATCRNGQWDNPVPICIKNGCDEIGDISNAVRISEYDGAWVNYYCFPGYKLVGSKSLYCDGMEWSATIPECVDDKSKPLTSCDFEENLCGWSQDVSHDFDWIRHNLRTPRFYRATGPAFDHTYGQQIDEKRSFATGYYMYFEGFSHNQNETARLISPVYDAQLAKNGCFVFFYHMYGRYVGGLRVYQKPQNVPIDTIRISLMKEDYLLFDQWAEQGDQWFGSVMPLKDYSQDFQIVIEGIQGPRSYLSDVAFDDVAILQGENCSKAMREAPTPTPINVESCEGRCHAGGESLNQCGCDISCAIHDNCCSDYLSLCEFYDPQDSYASTAELPQTQKLIATKTTKFTTATLPVITTPATTSTETTLTPTAPRSSTVTPRTTTTTPRTTTTTPRTTTTTPRTTTTTIRTTTTRTPTTKLTTTHSVKTSSTSTTPSTTTIAPYTRYTQKAITSTTPKLRTTNNRRWTISSTLKFSTPKISTIPTSISSTSTIRTITTQANVTTTKSSPQKKIQSEMNGKGIGGSNVAVVAIVVIVLICGVLWTGYRTLGARRVTLMAHLRGRISGESEVRYLTSDVNDVMMDD